MGEGEQDVLALGIQAGAPECLLRSIHVGCRTLRERNVEAEMLVPAARFFPRRRKALQRVLPHRLQQLVSPVARIERDQRLVDQMTQQVQHVARRDVVGRADRLRDRGYLSGVVRIHRA